MLAALLLRPRQQTVQPVAPAVGGGGGFKRDFYDEDPSLSRPKSETLLRELVETALLAKTETLAQAKAIAGAIDSRTLESLVGPTGQIDDDALTIILILTLSLFRW